MVWVCCYHRGMHYCVYLGRNDQERIMLWYVIAWSKKLMVNIWLNNTKWGEQRSIANFKFWVGEMDNYWNIHSIVQGRCCKGPAQRRLDMAHVSAYICIESITKPFNKCHSKVHFKFRQSPHYSKPINRCWNLMCCKFCQLHRWVEL